jgi:Peptidase family M28
MLIQRRAALCSVLAIALCAPLARMPAQAAVVDPVVSALVAQVSAARLQADDLRLAGFGTRNLFSEVGQPSGRGVFAARDWLAGRFGDIAKSSDGRMSVRLESYLLPRTDRTPRDVTLSSVIATLHGDDPKRGTIVISSHYDSRNSDGNDAKLDAPGADDDGSGVAALLEAARILARTHFPATIVFACFDGEEQGLLGSDLFAKALKSRGVVVEADLNDDIIGASRGHDGTAPAHDVRLFSEALPVDASAHAADAAGSENDSPSREIARFVKETASIYVPAMNVDLVYRSDRLQRGGDQQSFAAQGFPAVRFVEARENYDHQHQYVRVENGVQYGDLPGFLDFGYLAGVTQVNVAALATLALAPPAPDAGLLVRELGYGSTLQWSRVPGAASYELVWRPTTASEWLNAQNVGDVLTATLDVSKDDFIIGVRAIDTSGRIGPAAFPQQFR